ncbi:MAG: hypothetical protein HGB17_13585, partial [Syntrophobacteraceae bacterium]|nr:hypothetical protein [Syntrophobacteraceae bacterium]
MIWIDLEMTGLAVISSTILEIAVVITDADLRELGRWPSGVVGQAIRQPESVLAGMEEWGKRTHTQTGLLGPQGGRHVVHIDLHTGLGPKGVCKLLIDYPLSEDQ